jgi:hypothetical protein
MKKLIMFCFVVNSFLGFSQGNLQFNQVKLVTTVETVPVGKIWKIESVVYSQIISGLSSSSTGEAANNAIILIDGNNIVVRSARQNIGGGSGVSLALIWEQSYPIWLSSGTTLASSTGVQYISVIEFNQIP